MEQDIIWLIGAIISVAGLIGGVIARDRYVIKSISSGDQKVKEGMDTRLDALHERVNRVRDEYVKRVDLDNHIVRLESSVQSLTKDLHASTSQTNQRLDAILAHFAGLRKE